MKIEYGGYYCISEMADRSEILLKNIDDINILFFSRERVLYDRKDILCTIQVGKSIQKLNVKIPMVSHPAVYSAMQTPETNKPINEDNSNEYNVSLSKYLYMELINLISSMINIVLFVYEQKIEAEIQNNSYIEALKFLAIEYQSDKYNRLYPQKFIDKYKEYINKRIKDLRELIDLDKLDFGIELKEIIESYKLGLEVNIKGKNLLTPLLEGKYQIFINNLINSLFIPSYHDVQKDEKEKYFHIYLLGVLEGRLNLYNLKSNKESGFGRYDICAFPVNKKHPGLIIEVKSDQTKITTALAQINENNYVNELRIEGVKEVLAMAINFGHKQIDTDHKIINL